jgi:hypothetical protein
MARPSSGQIVIATWRLFGYRELLTGDLLVDSEQTVPGPVKPVTGSGSPGRNPAGCAVRVEVIGKGSEPGQPATPRSNSARPAANRCAAALSTRLRSLAVRRTDVLDRA